MKAGALGFLAAAVGLFAMPHGLGVSGIVTAAAHPLAEAHGRALLGVLLAGGGGAVGLAGSLAGLRGVGR
jgi:hypothetical protein